MKANYLTTFLRYSSTIKILVCALALCAPVTRLTAQTADSSAMPQQKLFVSLEDALINPSAVFRLSLSKQHLKNIPEAVYSFSNLRELDISRNQIRELPADIGQLKNLEKLDLSDNDLSTLPAGIGFLTSLKWLDLKRNRMVSLPVEISNLVSLTELNLWGNQIIHFPMEMMALRPSLKKIDMRGITIKTIPRNAITDLLPDTEIYFSGCNCN